MKRQISTLASMLLLIALVFTFASCDAVNGLFGGSDEHQHTYSEDWSSDETNHWHAATCENGDECKTAVSAQAAHAFGADGKCTVCAYEKPAAPHEHNFVDGKCECGATDPSYVAPHEHTYADTLTAGETTHWYAATCEAGDECATAKKDEAAHDFANGDCVCGAKAPVVAPDGTMANPFALTVPGTLDVNFVGGYDPIWYVFTATETKTLSVTLSSNNACMAYGVNVNDVVYTAKYQTNVKVNLTAGTTYYVAFCSHDGDAAEYTVTAEYVVSPYERVLHAGNNTVVFSAAEVEANAASRKLVIDEAANYKFASGNLFVASVVDANGNAIAKNDDYTYTLAAGEYTVNFGMLSMFGVAADTDCTLNVENPNAEDDDEGDVTGESDFVIGENTVTLTNEEAVAGKEFTFVANAAGTYTFSGLNVNVYNAMGMQVGRGEAYLDAGVYTLVVGNIDEVGGEFTLTISYTAPEIDDGGEGDYGTEEEPTEITFPAENLVTNGDSIGYAWYTFTTTEAGIITVTYSNENVMVRMYNVDDEEESFFKFGSQTIFMEVNANTTYKLGLGVWEPEDGVTATVTFGEGSVEPDGSMDYPFEVDGYPFNTDITLGMYGEVYYTFVAPANGFVTVEVSGDNVDALTILGNASNKFTSVVLAGEDYYFNIFNDSEAEVAFSLSVTFEEAELTAEDYKEYMVGRSAYDADWYWCIVFDVTDDGVYYARITDGPWESCYFYDFDVVVNADGSYTIILNSILDLSAIYEYNFGDEYVMANELNVILTYGEDGYVLNFEATPVDESELSGTGAKNDPYVIPGSGVYAFADVNDYPGKAISFTADKALTLKLSADVAELYTLSFSSKLAGDGEVYEITLAEGETFSCFVCMFSGTADVKLTVEVADVESGDNEEDDEEIVDGTEYYGTNDFGSSLTLIVGDSTVTFIYSSQMMGESEATFVYLLVDGAFVLYADGVEVNPLAANITVDENGVPVSAVYNGYNFILSTEKPGEGEEEEQTNNLVVGDNTIEVQDTSMGDTYALPVADETVTYVLTVGANGVIILSDGTVLTAEGSTTEITVPAGETVTVGIGALSWSYNVAVISVAIKEASTPDDGGDEPGTSTEGTGTAADPIIITELPYTVSFAGDHDKYLKYTVTEDCTIVITYTAGYVSGLPANFEKDASTKSYTGEVKAGDVLNINPWGSVNATYTIAVATADEGGEDEGGDTVVAEPVASVTIAAPGNFKASGWQDFYTVATSGNYVITAENYDSIQKTYIQVKVNGGDTILVAKGAELENGMPYTIALNAGDVVTVQLYGWNDADKGIEVTINLSPVA